MSEEGGGPYLLAVDSSSEHCLVAVARGEELLAALEWSCPREHSRELLAAVSTVLQHGHVEKSDLDAVAVMVGPGSYAGLRVGVSTASRATRLAWTSLTTATRTRWGLAFVGSHPESIIGG